jgi:hypothetical protein
LFKIYVFDIPAVKGKPALNEDSVPDVTNVLTDTGPYLFKNLYAHTVDQAVLTMNSTSKRIDEEYYIGNLLMIVSITSLLNWFRIFQYLLPYRNIGAFIRMIIEIFADIQHFLVVLLIALLGFFSSFYVLFKLDWKDVAERTAAADNCPPLDAKFPNATAREA